MYKVVAASPEGDVVLWRTPAPAVEGALKPCGQLLVPLVPLKKRRHVQVEHPVVDLTFDPASSPAAEGVTAYCAGRNLAVRARKKISQGEIVVVRDQQSLHFVVKRQAVGKAAVDYEATPVPCFCELRALQCLKQLMESSRVAPVFCEFVNHTVWSDVLSITMTAYMTDLADWMRGNGRDAARKCPTKPDFHVAASTGDSWIYTRCAGHQLATSNFQEDKKLFNNILRATVLQVLIGLAQGQRHCLLTHNDLHSGNVMFEHCASGLSRLLVTGCGSFLLPRRSARARIIDFQHACFDRYDEAGCCVGRVSGVRDDVHNSFSITYDVWRFCSNLVFEILRPYKDTVDADILAVLHAGAQVPVGSEPAQMHYEFHWKPYLLEGPTAEELLAWPAFDCYRVETAAAAADEVWFERSPSADAQDRYLRVRMLRHGGNLPLHRDDVYALFPLPARVAGKEVREKLRVFATNYEGTMLARATVYHKHPPVARARFLYMELTLLDAVLDHLFSEACAHELTLRAADAAELCALADAIGVVLHADWNYIARPAHLADYNERVRTAARLPCVKAASSSLAQRPRMSFAEESALLAVTHDGDLERFRGVFLEAVMKDRLGAPP